MLSIRTVTVIGSTGTMCANVAGIFDLFGNVKVYCVARDIERVKKTIPRNVKLVWQTVLHALEHLVFPLRFWLNAILRNDRTFLWSSYV